MWQFFVSSLKINKNIQKFQTLYLTRVQKQHYLFVVLQQ